jgi:transposase-like protein
LKCTSQEFQSGESKISPRLFGAARYHQELSATSTKKVYVRIEKWRSRELKDEYPYVFLDGIWLKRCWGGEVKNLSILIAVAVNKDGYREVLGAQEGCKEDKESWSSFLKHLKERGLKGVRLITSDKCLGLVESISEVFPEADWQRCIVHWYRNVLRFVPKSKVSEVAAMLKAIHAQEDRYAAIEKAESVVKKLEEMKLRQASSCVNEGYVETLTYASYPRKHWRKLRTNNMLERIMKAIRRRTRVVGSFPDGNSALMLVAARLRHIAGTKWGVTRYMKMDMYRKEEEESKEYSYQNDRARVELTTFAG